MKTQKLCVVILLLIGLCLGLSQAICTERGKFPYDENRDCRGFVMCIWTGNFTELKANCPEGFVYNHEEQKCTNATNYKCYPEFICTTVKNYTDPHSQDCTSYISCIDGMSGTSTARLIVCPVNNIFNPSLERCVYNSVAQCGVNHDKGQSHDENPTNSSVHVSNNAVSIKVHHAPFLFIILSLLNLLTSDKIVNRKES